MDWSGCWVDSSVGFAHIAELNVCVGGGLLSLHASVGISNRNASVCFPFCCVSGGGRGYGQTLEEEIGRYKRGLDSVHNAVDDISNESMTTDQNVS